MGTHPTDLLSLSLATHQGQHQAPTSRSLPAGSNDQQGLGEPHPLRAIRILLNSPGSLCYANAFLQGLAWQMLLCEAVNPDVWLQGFGMMVALTLFTPEPLDIRHMSSFLELLTQGWSVDDLMVQHDLIEFGQFLLFKLQPSFLSGHWAPLPLLNGTALGDTHLWSEKGCNCAAIALPLIDVNQDSVNLQTLVHQWHDALGLCKLLSQASSALCLCLERATEIDTPKLQTKVLIDEMIAFPTYDLTNEDYTWTTYTPVGLAVHLGHTIRSGHYRAILKQDSTWYAYDDGKVPERRPNIPPFVESNVVFIWLVRTHTSTRDDQSKS